MSAFDNQEARQEIIIVKRGGGDHEEGHHGGVWKIAFADFMTAMMCFFLVMWLVNATNEETKAAVASYFNPMSLVEPTPTGSGVDDPGVSPRSTDESGPEADKTASDTAQVTNELAGPGEFSHSLDHSDTKQTSDQHLFSDPYAVLAEIAADTGTLQNISSKGDGGAQDSGPATGAQGGESYRDPFAPDFWSREIADPDAAELDVFREEQDPAAPEATEQPVAEPVVEPVEDIAAGTDQLLPEEPDPAPVPQSEQLADTIRQELAAVFGQGDALNQTISVTATSDGVMISVTDELNYGMFQVGSAVPQQQLVLAMEKISETLKAQPGSIRIHGHTDGRPFRTDDYDNWRLSTARAHSAYYMLVRTGLDEGRIKGVAGFADRDLKVPENPNADANRRIEIFLETNS